MWLNIAIVAIIATTIVNHSLRNWRTCERFTEGKASKQFVSIATIYTLQTNRKYEYVNNFQGGVICWNVPHFILFDVFDWLWFFKWLVNLSEVENDIVPTAKGSRVNYGLRHYQLLYDLWLLIVNIREPYHFAICRYAV